MRGEGLEEFAVEPDGAGRFAPFRTGGRAVEGMFLLEGV